MNRQTLVMLIWLAGLSQPVLAKDTSALTDQQAPEGRMVTPLEMLATVLGFTLLMCLFGVRKRHAPAQSASLAQHLLEAIGNLHATEDGRGYGTRLLEQQGDRKIYASVWVEDRADIRREEAEKYRKRLRRVVLFLLLFRVLLFLLLRR